MSCAAWPFQSSTSCPSRTCSLWSCRTSKSCCTSQILCRREGCRIALTSSMWCTLWDQSSSKHKSNTRRLRGTPLLIRVTMLKRSRCLSCGSSSLKRYHLCRVSPGDSCNEFVLESRGSTVHLLKSQTKPVSKRAKRKTFDLLKVEAADLDRLTTPTNA